MRKNRNKHESYGGWGCDNKKVAITFYMTLRPQQEQYQLLGSLQNDIITTATESSMKIQLIQ